MSYLKLPASLQALSRGAFASGIGAIAVTISSCGDEEKSASMASSSEGRPEPKVSMKIIAEEAFQYSNGIIEGNQSLQGFKSVWTKEGKGLTSVEGGVATIIAPARLSCPLDNSPSGPFADYLDEEGFIGKDGTVIFMSFYQELMDAISSQVNLVEVARGPGNIHFVTQFNTGNDTQPEPFGPFGLRVKRDPTYSVPAPESINRRENLIVLRIQFGEGDQDEISYYYNPIPGEEDSPVDTVFANDLSFDRIGLACFKEGSMKVRSMLFVDHFDLAARER